MTVPVSARASRSGAASVEASLPLSGGPASTTGRVTHWLVALSHRRLGAQSASEPQPQRPVARQTAPAPADEHAAVSPVAHCAQALERHRVRPSARPAHCASARHSTQRLAPPSAPARHTGRVGEAAVQSASRLHVVVQVPGRVGSSLVHD